MVEDQLRPAHQIEDTIGGSELHAGFPFGRRDAAGAEVRIGQGAGLANKGWMVLVLES